MSHHLEIEASVRSQIGTSASRRLRHKALVPAVLYGGDSAPQSLTIEHRLLSKALENEGFLFQCGDFACRWKTCASCAEEFAATSV